MPIMRRYFDPDTFAWDKKSNPKKRKGMKKKEVKEKEAKPVLETQGSNPFLDEDWELSPAEVEEIFSRENPVEQSSQGDEELASAEELRMKKFCDEMKRTLGKIDPNKVKPQEEE